MSASHHDQLSDLGQLHLNKDTAGRLSVVLLGVGLVCLLLTAGSMLGEGLRDQALHSYLAAYLFVLTLALGGLFFTVLQHLVGAYWSVSVRRITEMVAANLPALAVLFLPIALGMHHLFPWAGHEAHHPAVVVKAGYLNTTFFLIRAAIYLLFWAGLATVLYRRSLDLDDSGDPMILVGLRRLSGPAMLLFALTVTFASFDWLMSLDPEWFSTMFGVYAFAGLVLSSLSLFILIGLLLRRAGLLANVITIEHYHDLGKLVFGFIVFWTYIAYSQYMLIWYGNLPEETLWFQQRWTGSWATVSVLLVIFHFAVPFFVLLPRGAKRSPAILGTVAALLIVMHYVDLYWLVMPQLHRGGVSVHWLDVTALVGLGGVFAGLLVRRLGSAPLVPIKDPLLRASLEFENNA